jgi:hypothetical protein
MNRRTRPKTKKEETKDRINPEPVAVSSDIAKLLPLLTQLLQQQQKSASPSKPSIGALASAFDMQRISPLRNTPDEKDAKTYTNLSNDFERTIKWINTQVTFPPDFGELLDPNFVVPANPTRDGYDRFMAWISAEQREMRENLEKSKHYLKKAGTHAKQGAMLHNRKRRYLDFLEDAEKQQTCERQQRAKAKRDAKRIKCDAFERKARSMRQDTAEESDHDNDDYHNDPDYNPDDDTFAPLSNPPSNPSSSLYS